jgi:short-subunit dehydrogenase
VIHVASLAGLLHGSPGSTLYAASKAFLVRFAESLALELEGTGVTATAVCPGFVYSEFHDVAGTRERVRTLPKAAWLQADEVARTGLDAASSGQAVYVNGALNRGLAQVFRHLPDAAGRALMRRHGKRFRNV